METMMCSHSVHQVSDLKKSQYDIALAVISSLMEDCSQAQRVIEAVVDSPSGLGCHDRHAQGAESAYRAMLSNLQAWRDALKKE